MGSARFISKTIRERLAIAAATDALPSLSHGKNVRPTTARSRPTDGGTL
jgi:hypothetical protein